MHKKIILLVLIYCLILGTSSIAAAHDIQFENRTDFHWVAFYINYDGEGRYWGDNLLGGQVNRGESVTIDVHGTHRNVYKIKIVERSHGEYNEIIWHDVNLEDADRVIMHYNRYTGEISYRVIRY